MLQAGSNARENDTHQRQGLETSTNPLSREWC